MTSGRPAFWQHAKHAEGSDTSYVSHTRKALSTECENRNFDRNEKRLRSPAGPRRLRNSDAHKRIAVPKALCVLRERTTGQDPKAAKYAVLIPGPGMFVNVQLVSRVMIAPHPKRSLFRRVCHCVRSFEQGRVVATFARESERGPFVPEVLKSV